MTQEQILSCALDIGEQMLLCGAEVGRVETAIRFICSAYGCRRTDVFTITSSIVVSVEDENGSHGTQTRRILGGSTDLSKLHRLNDLSRQVCVEKPDYEYIRTRLRGICVKEPYPLWLQALGSALIAFSFAVFFGGSWVDGLVAAPLGLGLRYDLDFAAQRHEPDLHQLRGILFAGGLRHAADPKRHRAGCEQDHHRQHHAADPRHRPDQLPAGYDQR